MDWLASLGSLYWNTFALTFAAVAFWETFRPRRQLNLPLLRRWGSHATLMALYYAASVLLYGTNAVFLSEAVRNSEFGLLNRPEPPFAVRCVIALVLLDLVKYAQHWSYHNVGFLWRLHQVHHADPDYDLTTGLRFHPLEALLTHGSYLLAIALMAPPVAAVFAAELLTVMHNLFAHANASLPGGADRLLRVTLVTPDMHRVHHSDEYKEQNANFGSLLSWWDRLFGTYVAAPAAGHDKMTVGLRGVQNLQSLNVPFLLALPFRRMMAAAADRQSGGVAGTIRPPAAASMAVGRESAHLDH